MQSLKPLKVQFVLATGIMSYWLLSGNLANGQSQSLTPNSLESEVSVDEFDLEALDSDEATEKMWQSANNSTPSRIPQVAIEQIVEPESEYRYAAFGHPNPFLRTGVSQAEQQFPVTGELSSQAAPSGAEIPVVSPLQRYPLDALKLKGIWQKADGSRKALIMTPDREGVIVKEKDPISAGKVLEINPEMIVVRQYRIRRDGVREYQDFDLQLGQIKEETKSFVRLAPGEQPQFSPPPKKPVGQLEIEIPSSEEPGQQPNQGSDSGQVPAGSQKPPGLGGVETPVAPLPPQNLQVKEVGKAGTPQQAPAAGTQNQGDAEP